MSDRINHIRVCWRAPTGMLLHAGDLTRELVKDGALSYDWHTFKYGEYVAAARMDGFLGIHGIPFTKIWSASGLPYFFWSRGHMSKARPDYQRIKEQYGVNDMEDPFEFMVKVMRTCATDRIELYSRTGV